MNAFYSVTFVCIFACCAVGAYFQWGYLPQIAERTALKNERLELLQDYQQTQQDARDLRVVYQISKKGQLDLKRYKKFYFYSKQNAKRAIQDLFLSRRTKISELDNRKESSQMPLTTARYGISFTKRPSAYKKMISRLSASLLPVFLDSMNCKKIGPNYECRVRTIVFLNRRDAINRVSDK